MVRFSLDMTVIYVDLSVRFSCVLFLPYKAIVFFAVPFKLEGPKGRFGGTLGPPLKAKVYWKSVIMWLLEDRLNHADGDRNLSNGLPISWVSLLKFEAPQLAYLFFKWTGPDTEAD